MKTDLIRKEDAIKAIFDWMDTHKKEVLHKQDVAEVIMPLPSAEKTGKWTRESVPSTMNFYLHRCSECEGTAEEAMKYCCHCGARMVGSEEKE